MAKLLNFSSKLFLCLISISLLILMWLPSTTYAVTYNVLSFGAKGDGLRDSTQPFFNTWASACNSSQSATIYVPKGRFLIKSVVFRGPCKSKIQVQIDGTLVAPMDYNVIGNGTGYWILFIQVNNITVIGGYLDAKGASFWACRNSTASSSCPVGARSITFNWANNIVIAGLTSLNSQIMHLVINSCNNVLVSNVKLMAPDDSPNTDGIHVQGSKGVIIRGCSIRTGDDCVSIGPNTYNLWMERIQCGPGHGVSIGSLARELNEGGVENVTLINSVFSESDNGLRIKSWARPSSGYVNNILFENIVMKNVKNPIIINQNYCPDNINCPGQTSGVKISNVTYNNIRGTSATKVAVKFDCSPTTPCSSITLHDVNLNYLNATAKSLCKNIGGTTSGLVMPDSCL